MYLTSIAGVLDCGPSTTVVVYPLVESRRRSRKSRVLAAWRTFLLTIILIVNWINFKQEESWKLKKDNSLCRIFYLFLCAGKPKWSRSLQLLSHDWNNNSLPGHSCLKGWRDYPCDKSLSVGSKHNKLVSLIFTRWILIYLVVNQGLFVYDTRSQVAGETIGLGGGEGKRAGSMTRSSYFAWICSKSHW